MTSRARPLDVAIDVGGTFTDVVMVDAAGEVQTAKLLSTPPDFEQAVVRGIASCLVSHHSQPDEVAIVLHGTTVATNAVLEGRGSIPALVTTRGFRDVLELATGRRPTLYNLLWEKPKPLAPRRLRFEVNHRITSRGELDPALSAEEIGRVADRIARSEVESVAVCLINSYLAPEEERRFTDQLRSLCPGVMFSASVDLSPEPGEFERTSTAVVNAYVGPTVARYLDKLERDLRSIGVTSSIYVMQSSGGLIGVTPARQRAAQLIESGPAAGVVAARELAKRLGGLNLIAFDMGGTTAKASLIEKGETFESLDYEVGAGLNANRGYSTGAGYYIRLPSLDIAEVGAGGGSIFWVDRGGSPRVGPRSAGALPGPACYGLGATEATLSDACVVLGYFNPTAIAGGVQPIDRDLAHGAITPIARRLRLSVSEAAYGAIRIAVSNMTTLVRAVTTQRGRDPRRYSMVAFGGSGPAYAAELARALGVSSIIVPPMPGLWSAIGLIASDAQHDAVAYNATGKIDIDAFAEVFARLDAEAMLRLRLDGYRESEIVLERYLDMRYRGQKGTLRVSVPSGPFGREEFGVVLDDLERAHRETYGHSKSRDLAEVVNVRLRARYHRTHGDVFKTLSTYVLRRGLEAAGEERVAYFGPEAGAMRTPIITRENLAGEFRRGPLIIEEMDSTTLVPPWAQARLDELGNVVITLGPG